MLPGAQEPAVGLSKVEVVRQLRELAGLPMLDINALSGYFNGSAMDVTGLDNDTIGYSRWFTGLAMGPTGLFMWDSAILS